MSHSDPNPLNNETDPRLSLDDMTLLALMGVGALVLLYVFLLGMLCATHRIEAAVLML